MDDRSPPYLGPTYKPIFTPLISDAHGPLIMAFEDANGKYTRMELTIEQAATMAYSFLKILGDRVSAIRSSGE